MKSLDSDNCPCWYDMSLVIEEDAFRIIFKIHREVIDYIQKNMNISVVSSPEVMREYGFSHFSTDFAKEIFYDGMLKNIGTEDCFVKYEIIVRSKISEEEATRVCKNMNIMFMILGYTDVTGQIKGYGLNQLMVLDTNVKSLRNKVGHPYCFSGIISKILRMELNKISGRGLECLADRMFDCYKIIFPEDGALRKQFYSAINEDGFLVATSIGNACEIEPPGSILNESGDVGCQFDTHNVESAFQQIVLLVSVISLFDYARNVLEIK